MENRRVSGGRTVQRHVLYLGEINDAQRAAWCQTNEAFSEGGQQARQIALFPEDRLAPAVNCDVVHVRLSGLRLHRPRQWGACWLACHVWDQLRLDDFWSPRLPASREGTRWLDVLKTLVAYRLIDPGSEWPSRLMRQSSGSACWTCGYAGRGNGAPVGWRGSCGRRCSWTASGATAWLRAARERDGIRSCRYWSGTG